MRIETNAVGGWRVVTAAGASDCPAVPVLRGAPNDLIFVDRLGSGGAAVRRCQFSPRGRAVVDRLSV